MANTENPLNLRFDAAAFPADYEASLSEFAAAFVERLTVVALQNFALFVSGSTEPSSDEGPWAQDGRLWKFFSEDTGNYQPFLIDPIRLGYQISVDEPTDDEINIWFEIEEDGTPVAINFRQIVGGSVEWPSPYYLKSETFTQAEAAAALLYQERYSARAKPNSNQSVDINFTLQKLQMNSVDHDTASAYEAGNSRYVAAVKGIYRVAVVTQFDNDGGTASGMQIGLAVIKNGVGGGPNLGGNTVNIASPPGNHWNNAFAMDVSLEAGDYIELAVLTTDGVDTGDLIFSTNSFWCISLVQAIQA